MSQGGHHSFDHFDDATLGVQNHGHGAFLVGEHIDRIATPQLQPRQDRADYRDDIGTESRSDFLQVQGQLTPDVVIERSHVPTQLTGSCSVITGPYPGRLACEGT